MRPPAHLGVPHKLRNRRRAVAQVPHLEGGAAVVVGCHHQLGGHLWVPLHRAAAPLAVGVTQADDGALRGQGGAGRGGGAAGGWAGWRRMRGTPACMLDPAAARRCAAAWAAGSKAAAAARESTRASCPAQIRHLLLRSRLSSQQVPDLSRAGHASHHAAAPARAPLPPALPPAALPWHLLLEVPHHAAAVRAGGRQDVLDLAVPGQVRDLAAGAGCRPTGSRLQHQPTGPTAA